MKVYYNGLNLYRQFPSGQNIVENFIDHVYDATNIEVSYQNVVLLVADVVVIKGAKNETVTINGKVSHVSYTEDKVLVLLHNGELLKITETVSKVPKLMALEGNEHIVQISAGSKLTVALTNHGSLYNIPNKLQFKADSIVEMKTGREHCVLLDKNGSVFTFGRGSRGQLGHGSLEDEGEPRFVEALGGIKVQSVAAGGWHSCALSKDGDVYTWGWNGGGQLGIGEQEAAVMATPQVLNLEFNVRLIGCGNKHTVILTDDGKLYGCGWNKYKQLMKDDKENFHEMMLLGDFSKEVVTSLKCGPWNTLVVCEG